MQDTARHTTFLATGREARSLLAEPGIGRAWTQPSALHGYAVGGLCTHMARALARAERHPVALRAL